MPSNGFLGRYSADAWNLASVELSPDDSQPEPASHSAHLRLFPPVGWSLLRDWTGKSPRRTVKKTNIRQSLLRPPAARLTVTPSVGHFFPSVFFLPCNRFLETPSDPRRARPNVSIACEPLQIQNVNAPKINDDGMVTRSCNKDARFWPGKERTMQILAAYSTFLFKQSGQPRPPGAQDCIDI